MAKGSKKPRFPILPLNTTPWRKMKGWSRAELADRMGVSENTLRRYENAEVNWDQEALQRAAHALGRPLADILPPQPGSIADIWASVPEQSQDAALAMLRGLAGKAA